MMAADIVPFNAIVVEIVQNGETPLVVIFTVVRLPLAVESCMAPVVVVEWHCAIGSGGPQERAVDVFRASCPDPGQVMASDDLRQKLILLRRLNADAVPSGSEAGAVEDGIALRVVLEAVVAPGEVVAAAEGLVVHHARGADRVLRRECGRGPDGEGPSGSPDGSQPGSASGSSSGPDGQVDRRASGGREDDGAARPEAARPEAARPVRGRRRRPAQAGGAPEGAHAHGPSEAHARGAAEAVGDSQGAHRASEAARRSRAEAGSARGPAVLGPRRRRRPSIRGEKPFANLASCST